jgi:4-hydroxy-3-methylbut-2-en-1-yl diphosphate reductase
MGSAMSRAPAIDPSPRAAGDVLVVAPLLVEAFAIKAGARALRVRSTGMGPARARAAVTAIREDPAAALIVAGFCGGLSQDSELGEAIVAEEVIELDRHGRADGAGVKCSGASLIGQALSRSGMAVRSGRVASVERIVTGSQRERVLASGALAVDMESAWLAQAAAGRPFAVIRIVSDTPRRELRRRLPVGPPLPTLADSVRALAALRRAATALGALVGERELHTVFDPVLQRAAG